MSSVKEIFKKLNLSRKNAVLRVCSFFAIVLLIFSEFSGAEEKNEDFTVGTGVSSGEYIKTQEEKLEALLENIDGAGEVSVMLTLESCYENVYLKDSAVKTEKKSDDFSKEEQESYITVKSKTNDEQGVIIKVYEPVVKGVAVVAEGGNKTETKIAILETVSAVFNINSANISVEKMKSEGMK